MSPPKKVLFSADGFGRFGAVAKVRREGRLGQRGPPHYLNIVGKYGPQVQALRKKAAHWTSRPSARSTAPSSPATLAST